MNEILSSNVVVQNRFSFRKMLEIHQVVKEMPGAVFLSSKQNVVVEASSLSKLVSFLLTIDSNTNLNIIIVGTNDEQSFHKLARMLTNETPIKKAKPTPFIESSDLY